MNVKTLFGFGAVLASAALLQAEPVITVDADAVRGPVRPLVFGHNVEAADSRGIFSAGGAEPRSLEVGYGQGFWDPERNQSAAGVLEIMKSIPFGALRYPGGCLAHNFDWKKTVGPIGERASKNWTFGLDEYLRLCADLKCEPQIIIADYTMEPEELARNAADLVEYLNMPATAEYPWAMKRAANGHPEPYAVKYFEIGNESEHGNHGGKPSRSYTAEQYTDYFNRVVTAMKRVDPTIKTGLQTINGGSEWDRTVYDGAAKNADFTIYHTYRPQSDALSGADTFTGAMAGNTQLFRQLRDGHAAMAAAGRDLPIGVTEFNINSIAGGVEARRFSFAAGMLCAEAWCEFLQPEMNILFANYWHILNAMYGPVRTIPGAKVPEHYTGTLLGYSAPVRFFQTLKQGFGEELVTTVISANPLVAAPAFPGVAASIGDRDRPASDWFAIPNPAFNLRVLNTAVLAARGNPKQGTLEVDLKDLAATSYIGFARILRPAQVPDGVPWSVKMSFEAKFTPTPGNDGFAALGFGLLDDRGWDKTRSGSAIYALQGAKEWTRFSGALDTINGCTGLYVTFRAENVNGKVNGKLELRDLRFEARTAATAPKYPGLSSYASKSSDGKTLFLIVFNRQTATVQPVKIVLDNFAASAGTMWELYREDPADTAYFEPAQRPVELRDNAFGCRLPAHSMTLFRFQAD